MSKALVTGGAGFIGSNITRALVEQGREVIVLDNLSSGYQHNLDGLDGVKLIKGDVRDEGLVRKVMNEVDVVFHLAASVGNTRSIEHPIEDSEINVIGTLRILEAARQAGVRKIVCSSSAGIFGELKYLPIREDHPIEPDTPYGVSKLAEEKHCLAYSKLYEIEAVCLRYFNVFGINQRYDAYGNVIPIFVHRILRGQPLTVYGDGEQTRDFVNVRDVAKVNLLAAEAEGISGAFNIASGACITINHLVDLLRGASRINPDVEYAPPRKGDVLHSRADISAAREKLGYEPEVDLAGGLTEYFTWAKVNMT
jgi:UDP-glucose 4-epimerase